MSYIDRCDWHSGGNNFPQGLSIENAGTHIGIYLAWLIVNGMIGGIHSEEEEDLEAIELVKKREKTGRDFLSECCDCKFSEEDLNEEGFLFTEFYYGAAGQMNLYFYDYAEMFVKEGMNFYEVADSWENYDAISPVIDERFRSWKAVRKIFDQKHHEE